MPFVRIGYIDPWRIGLIRNPKAPLLWGLGFVAGAGQFLNQVVSDLLAFSTLSGHQWVCIL
jgi:hypothetical protein